MSAAAIPGAEAAAAPPARGKKKLIIIVAAVLLLALAGAGGTLFYMKKKAAEAAAAAEAEAEGEEAPAAHSARKEGKGEAAHVPTFVPLEPFVVNLADKDADRYAQVGVTLEIDDAKFAEQLKAYMPAIRNGILMVLAHKTSAELLERDGKEKLAREVARETSRGLGVEIEEEDPEDEDTAASSKKKKKKKVEQALPVTNVYFSTFIIQ